MSHDIALLTTHSVTAVLGTFGHVLMCKAVLTRPRLHRCSDFLAIAHLVVTMVCAPLLMAMVDKIALAHECVTRLQLAYSLTAHLVSHYYNCVRILTHYMSADAQNHL